MLRTAAWIASLAGALALAAPAFAGKPDAAPSGSTTIALVTPAGAGPGWPHFGDLVEFDVATTQTASPFVNLKCYQGGTLVGEGWEGYFDGALGNRLFGLSSPVWTSGAADCTAWVDRYANGHWRELASTSFHVSA